MSRYTCAAHDNHRQITFRQQTPAAAAPREPSPASQPAGPRQSHAVADALDDLAGQIKDAASAHRHPDQDTASAEAGPVAGSDPRAIVELVTDELSRRGIKPGTGAGADLARAEASAARLLADLGICSS